MDVEKEQLIRELVSIHNIQENPDFEDEVREILGKYIVFFKDRLPKEEQIYETIET